MPDGASPHFSRRNFLGTTVATGAVMGLAACSPTAEQSVFEKGGGAVSGGEARRKYSFHSFGCHFVEVMVDEPIGRCGFARFCSVMDNGRVINHKTARSQVIGGVTIRLGMSLMELTEFGDDGRSINDSLADCDVCVKADVPVRQRPRLPGHSRNRHCRCGHGDGERGISCNRKMY